MNDAQRSLRLMEIAPLKSAMIQAMNRLSRFEPPFHSLETRRPDIFLEELVMLVSVANGNDVPALVKSFCATCESASEQWFSIEHELKKKAEESANNSVYLGQYVPTTADVGKMLFERNGDETVAAAKSAYDKLSEELETYVS